MTQALFDLRDLFRRIQQASAAPDAWDEQSDGSFHAYQAAAMKVITAIDLAQEAGAVQAVADRLTRDDPSLADGAYAAKQLAQAVLTIEHLFVALAYQADHQAGLLGLQLVAQKRELQAQERRRKGGRETRARNKTSAGDTYEEARTKILNAWSSGQYQSKNACAKGEAERLQVREAWARKCLQGSPSLPPK